MVGDVSSLVDSATLDRRAGTENSPYRCGQGLRAVDDDQQPVGGVQAAGDQIGQQCLDHGGVLRRAFPQPDRHLRAVRGDGQGDHGQVLSQVFPVDHEHLDIQRSQVAVQQLREGGLRRGDEPAGDRRAADRRGLRRHLLTDRFAGGHVATRGQPGQHPLHHHGGEPVLRPEHPVGGKGTLATIHGAGPGTSHRHPPPAQHHRPPASAVTYRGALGVVLTLRPTRRGDLRVEHRAHHRHPGSHAHCQQPFPSRPSDIGQCQPHLGRQISHAPHIQFGGCVRFRHQTQCRYGLHGGPLPSGVLGRSPETYHQVGLRCGTATQVPRRPRHAPAESRNKLSGTVFGPSVQSGSIRDVHIHGVSARRLPVPRQLPPVPVHFTGRGAELAQLDALLDPDGPPVVVVTGAGGVGKTAVAVAWAHRVSERFPGGQLYADLGGYSGGEPVDPAEVLGRFLRALGVPPQDVPATLAEQVALYRTRTADRMLLVVADNALSPAQARVLRPASAGSRMVVTSRGRLEGIVAEGALLVEVGLLSAGESVALLARPLGAERTSGDPGPAAALLTEDEEPSTALDDLTAANLLAETGTDRFRFHDLLRLHAKQTGEADDPPPVRDAARLAILEWYWLGADRADRLVTPYRRRLPYQPLARPRGLPAFSDRPQALAWLELERVNLLAAGRAAQEHGHHELAWHLSDVLWPVLLTA